MKNDKYILDENQNPIPEPDLLAWGRWFENSVEKRRVAWAHIGSYHISTVFLGLDYSFGGDTPVLWETMVFEAKESVMEPSDMFPSLSGKKYHKSMDQFSRRYFTKEEALNGHKEVMVEVMKYEEQNPQNQTMVPQE